MGRKTRWSPAEPGIFQCTHTYTPGQTRQRKKNKQMGRLGCQRCTCAPRVTTALIMIETCRCQSVGRVARRFSISSVERTGSLRSDSGVGIRGWGGVASADRLPLLPRLVAVPSWAPFQGIVIAFYSLEQTPRVMYPSSCSRHLARSGLS